MEDRHVSFTAHGVRVTFPFEPYPEQRDYCSHVIQAITKQQNAILESPTGTGKTLSLLTSSLAWQQSSSEQGRMIFYLSRTHIQLSQAAKEMKKTAYQRVPSVVLASRTHMCLNDEVKSQSQGVDISINRACQNAIAKNSCSFYSNYEEKLKARLEWNKVHDIEDLLKFGRANQCCPFYASKRIAESQASLVFMPYNYLLDLSVRRSTNLKLEKSVIIIDEGHNLEAALKDSASAKFTMAFLKTLQESCERLPSKLSEALMRDRGLSRQFGYDPDKRRGVQIVDEFKAPKSKSGAVTEKENKPNPMEELAEKLTNDKIQEVNSCARSLACCQDLLKTTQGRYVDTKCDITTVIGVLRSAGVNFATSDSIITTLESMATFWSIVGVVNARVIAGYMAAITNLCHFISLIYPPGTMSQMKFEAHLKSLQRHYSAYMIVEVERDSVLESSNKLLNWTLNLWCLNPGIGLRRVIDDACVGGPRSIIVTSGTLAPIEPIARDMEKEFKITKEFGHLITKNQMQITIVDKSPKGFPLDTTFAKTENPQCQTAIGETLSTLLSALPFGTLVFFPSYRLLRLVLSHCENKPFWPKLQKLTRIFKESKDQRTFADDMMQYKKIVDSGGRAVFIGVCRGKLSEGTNLERNHCRSVVIIGLPYPNRGDPQIQETLEFQKRRGDPGGQTWYTNQMRRALGQAIGRVIRSRDDFGMVFLCDPRFTMYKMLVSKWIQEYYPSEKISDYRRIAEDIGDFFRMHNIDISEMALSSVVGTTSTGAFELDTVRKNRALLGPSSSNRQSASSNAVSSSQSGLQERENKTTAEKFEDLRSRILSDYTVSPETFNKIKKRQQEKSSNSQEKPEHKRAKTTQDAFDIICADVCVSEHESDPTTSGQQQVLADTTTVERNGAQQNQQPKLAVPVAPKVKAPKKPKSDTASQSIAGPDKKKCWICQNPPVRPHEINCSCARVGCFECLRGLNKKPCGVCGTILLRKYFKPKLFNMFQKT